MVHMNNEDNPELEIENTNDYDPQDEETELVNEEEGNKAKINKIRQKLTQCEADKKSLMDELQRSKADFLNARKRLTDERAQDKIRHQVEHVKQLLPICDSFQMAMNDQAVWEKADESWRKGIEGIYAQLQGILDSYNVKTINPISEQFDPHRDEAIGTEEVTDAALVDTVVSVVQPGYEMKTENGTEIIRHARVTTGIKSK